MLTDLLEKFMKTVGDGAPSQKRRETVLLIDGLNMFIRSFMAVPTSNSDGIHIGGLAGFIRSLASVIDKFSPTKCIVVFDGVNGTYRRKKIYNGYKSGRVNTARLHRFVNTDALSEDPTESFKSQLSRLELYLSDLPVVTFMIDTLEADDAIAYMSRLSSDTDYIIVSNDNDFIQCVSDNVVLYSPVKKIVYTPKEVRDKFGIHHANYINYRILSGDKTDNISGVRGVGLKTLIKYIPTLAESAMTTDEIISYCESQLDAKVRRKFYQTISEARKTIDRNVDLMELSSDYLSGSDKILIRKFYESEPPAFNKMSIAKLFVEDGMNIYSESFLFKINTSFGRLKHVIS